MLKNILHFGRSKPDGRVGYSYVSNADDCPMSLAQTGQIVRVEGKGPPWIVVDEAPTTAILARWPGRLWKVSIIEAAPEKDQPLAYARYVRALAVKVIDEQNPARLFGEQGEGVLTILNHAAVLTHEIALKLSSVRHPDAPTTYDRVFRRWADAEGIEIGYDESLDGTLRVGSMPHGSPIYEGLSVLHTVVFQRAKILGGEAATTIEDEDEYLNEPWQTAGAVLADAALALGAPKFVSASDQAILLKGWAGLEDRRL
jgi:hypothetical protein